MSVGSLISLTSCLTSGLINRDPNRVIPVVLAVLALGTLVGLLNAALVIVLRVHPLIVTLGMGAILQGTTLFYALGPVGKVPRSFNFLAYGRMHGLPLGATIAVLLCLLIALVLRYLPLGRQVYAWATMPIRPGWSGLRRTRSSHAGLRSSGFCCAATGLYLAARFGRRPALYRRQLHARLDHARGARRHAAQRRQGRRYRHAARRFLIALLNNLLNFMDVSKHYQLVAQALIIILAVSVYIDRRRTV